MRAWLALAGAVVLAALVWRAYEWAVGIGVAKCELLHAQAAQSAADEVGRRDIASTAATGSMLDYLAASMPKIEETKNAAAERVRTIYRDRPVPAVCQRPDGVQAELDAARERANAASRL